MLYLTLTMMNMIKNVKPFGLAFFCGYCFLPKTGNALSLQNYEINHTYYRKAFLPINYNVMQTKALSHASIIR